MQADIQELKDSNEELKNRFDTIWHKNNSFILPTFVLQVYL